MIGYMNNKYSYLLKNVGLLAIGQFGSRFLTFLLVPLYTSILTTGDYGTFDFYVTVVQLLVPICTLNIYDGILRFCLDGRDRGQAYAVGASVFLLGSGAVALLVVLNLVTNAVPLLNEHPILLILYYMSYALNLLLSNYARGLDDVATTVVSGVLTTLGMIILNILFLVVFSWGLFGYFLANILGTLVGCSVYFLKFRLWRMPLRVTDKRLRQEMVRYSAPLILNSLSWWVNSSSSRYIILLLLGVSANGIFSVATKIPSIISTAANLFNSAWVMSSVKEFDRYDSDGFFSKTYGGFGGFVMLVCSALVLLSNVMGLFLYRGEFYVAWTIVPLLTLGTAFSAIAGYLGGLFAAAKKTGIYTYSTMAGCVSNILLTFLLIPKIGLTGAALATAISNYVILAIRFAQIRSFMNVNLHLIRDHVAYILVLIQCLTIIEVAENPSIYIVELVLFLIVVLLYRREINVIYSKIFNKKSGK